MVEQNKGWRTETNEEVSKFFNNPNFVHFFGMLRPQRPGVMLCFATLEHVYFTPGTALSKDFFFRFWGLGNTIWAVVSIPQEKMSLMKQVATESGLRIAEGIPHISDGRQIKSFPINNERAFTLQNIPGHLVYNNDPEEIRQLLEQEELKIDKIIKESNLATKEIKENQSSSQIEG